MRNKRSQAVSPADAGWTSAGTALVAVSVQFVP